MAGFPTESPVTQEPYNQEGESLHFLSTAVTSRHAVNRCRPSKFPQQKATKLNEIVKIQLLRLQRGKKKKHRNKTTPILLAATWCLRIFSDAKKTKNRVETTVDQEKRLMSLFNYPDPGVGPP